MSNITCRIMSVKEQVQGRFLPRILHEVYCSVYSAAGRALGRISPLTLLFVPATGCSDLPVIHTRCLCTTLHWACTLRRGETNTLLKTATPAHTARDIHTEARKDRVVSNSEQVVRGQRSCAIGTAVPLLAATAELWEGPGSRYDDLLYRRPQNIPSYQNDLNVRAWEGEQSPSIILKINPPLYSSAESINNVARGKNLQQRFILILWLLFISL